MRFISLSIPKPSKGQSFVGVKSVFVPDQSMSLEEILRRFTRGEAVPLGHETHYDEHAESDDSIDIEKMAHADLVDKAEYYQKLEEVKIAYDKQEKAKARKQREKEEADKTAAYEARIQAEAEKLAKEKLAKA